MGISSEVFEPSAYGVGVGGWQHSENLNSIGYYYAYDFYPNIQIFVILTTVQSPIFLQTLFDLQLLETKRRAL